MAFRLYIVPKIGAGVRSDLYRPKYFADGTVPPEWSGMDYNNWYLVGADLSASDHALIAGQSDTTAIPANLSNNLTAGQVATTQAKLEAANIPAQWVSTSLTWLEVVRTVVGIIQLSQRFAGSNGRAGLFSAGISLDSTIGDLSATVRTRLTNAATSMGLDISVITLGTTVRSALRTLGGQLQDRGFVIGGVTI